MFRLEKDTYIYIALIVTCLIVFCFFGIKIVKSIENLKLQIPKKKENFKISNKSKPIKKNIQLKETFNLVIIGLALMIHMQNIYRVGCFKFNLARSQPIVKRNS